MKKHKEVIALLRDKGPLDKGVEMAEEIRALMRDYPSDFYIDITRLEEAILVAVLRLDEEAYGVTINQEVSRIFNRTYTMGGLYCSLDQLYQKGLVSKIAADPSPERGGKSKTFYRLTREGKSALDEVRRHHETLWAKVPGLAGQGTKSR